MIRYHVLVMLYGERDFSNVIKVTNHVPMLLINVPVNILKYTFKHSLEIFSKTTQ